MIDDDTLGGYLNDHLAGATGASDMLRQHIDRNPDPGLATVLDELGEEIGLLKALIAELGLSGNPLKAAAGWVGEKASRVVREVERTRSVALVDLLELEAMQVGISGKRALWVLLQTLQQEHRAIAAQPLEDLIAQADHQLAIVEAKRVAAGRAALTG